MRRREKIFIKNFETSEAISDDRRLVKWYNIGLQNRGRGFDSFSACQYRNKFAFTQAFFVKR